MTADENHALLPLFEPAAQLESAAEQPVVVSMPTGPVIASDGLPARLIKPHTLGKSTGTGSTSRFSTTG